MNNTKPSELSAAGLQRVLKDARTRVAKETLQQGLAITVAEGDQLVQIQPDNSRHPLGVKVKPNVVITKTRFRLG